MQISFVAGVSPIVRDVDASSRFYRDILGVPLPEGDYPATDDLDGLKHFGVWTLAGAAQSCFGVDVWPTGTPIPQACIEFEVASPAAVGEAVAEITEKGVSLLAGPKEEPWGQTVARLLSPDGLLIGVTYTPWMHQDDEAAS